MNDILLYCLDRYYAQNFWASSLILDDGLLALYKDWRQLKIIEAASVEFTLRRTGWK